MSRYSRDYYQQAARHSNMPSDMTMKNFLPAAGVGGDILLVISVPSLYTLPRAPLHYRARIVCGRILQRPDARHARLNATTSDMPIMLRVLALAPCA